MFLFIVILLLRYYHYLFIYFSSLRCWELSGPGIQHVQAVSLRPVPAWHCIYLSIHSFVWFIYFFIFILAAFDAGSYLDSASNLCKQCPYGQYQPDKWQSSCLPCPTGNTTYVLGAYNVTQCLSEFLLLLFYFVGLFYWLYLQDLLRSFLTVGYPRPLTSADLCFCRKKIFRCMILRAYYMYNLFWSFTVLILEKKKLFWFSLSSDLGCTSLRQL
jgi:hypothetical protein